MTVINQEDMNIIYILSRLNKAQDLTNVKQVNDDYVTDITLTWVVQNIM
jgi:hypothetical protein